MSKLTFPALHRSPGTNGYSTREVADLLNVRPDHIRHYVRRGLLLPLRNGRGHYRFSFQDVVFLRTAKALRDASVGVRRSYRALTKLKGDLAQFKSLSSVRIYADGHVVVVRDDDKAWEVESGQLTMDFSVPDLAENVAHLARSTAGGGKPLEELDSDEWYNLGLDLEEVDPKQAPNAYREAVRLDAQNADAHVNLGRLYQLDGDVRGAKRHYELALAIAPTHELANYNLGTVFDELEDLDKAVSYYKRAPDIPDAHFNLSRLHELEGDEFNARRHLRMYENLLQGLD
jgi:DNA-binding transcriptional MerR regulator